MKELYIAPKPYSFDLNQDMMNMLHEEFKPDKVVAKFAEAIKNKSASEVAEIGNKIFTEYGREWIKRTLQLGEEYPDRTYEVLKEAVDQTGTYKFALLPQRFLEVAYLSTQDISTLPIVENNADRLIYKMVDCLTYKTIKEKCGEDVAKLMTCKGACLAACEQLHKDLDIDMMLDMEAEMAKDEYCQFDVRRA